MSIALLLASHLIAAATGGWLVASVQRGRRDALQAKAELLDVRETFVGLRVEQERQPKRPPRLVGADAPERPFVVPKPPSLLTATLDEAQVILSTAIARRVQEHRQFVDFVSGMMRRGSWKEAPHA
jgi:hypothetical protein